MNQPKESTDWVPDTILLLGTDASGKNHVAGLWANKLKELGCDFVVREGALCGPVAERSGHGDKGRLSLMMERGFIFFFPLMKWMVPAVLTLLLYWDALRFKPPKHRLLVVSHSALRILAFYLGQSERYERSKTLPVWLEKAIVRVQEVSKAMVIVLDVDDETRQQRIENRLREGSIDPFDRFMAADSERSERIEACLVAITMRYYQAHLVENNDLSDEALWEEFRRACAVHQKRMAS